MIDCKLYDMVYDYKNGEVTAFYKIMDKMNPLVKKYIALLGDGVFIIDFCFCLICMLNTINLDNFNDEYGEYKLLSYTKKLYIINILNYQSKMLIEKNTNVKLMKKLMILCLPMILLKT